MIVTDRGRALGNRRTITAFAVLVALVFNIGGRGVLAVPPTVEGDLASLKSVLAAQEQNLVRSDWGRADYTLTLVETFADKVVRDVSVSGTAVWRSGHCANECLVVESPPSPLERYEYQLRILQTPTGRTVYNRSVDLCRILEGDDRGLAVEHRVLPKDAWFRIADWRPVHEMIDPESPIFASVERKYVTEFDGTDRVRIRRWLADDPNAQVVDVSMAQGGNVVHYEWESEPENGFDVEGDCEWERTDKGTWRLVSHRFTVGQYQEGDLAGSRDYEFKVESFEAEPQIPARQFDFAWLELAQGTTVDELDAAGNLRRSYTFGTAKPQNVVDQEVLDELSRKVRERGFGAKERAESAED